MLVTDYYKVEKVTCTDGVYTYLISLNKECAVYEGHFPGSPVSPGVCNIQMIKECAEEAIGKSLFMNNLQLCRLTTLITPISHPQVEVKVTIAEADGIYKLKGSIGMADETYLDLKAELIEK